VGAPARLCPKLQRSVQSKSVEGTRVENEGYRVGSEIMSADEPLESDQTLNLREMRCVMMNVTDSRVSSRVVLRDGMEFLVSFRSSGVGLVEILRHEEDRQDETPRNKIS
jgi:hypothetical protein